MALQQRIESLKKRHAEIELKLTSEGSRPAPDGTLLHQLKIQKLSLKDELNRLLQGQCEAA